MNPLVSVILPVYNAEKYLDNAIESILNQTLTNFELLIVNDGSNDNSSSIISKFLNSDSRIVLIEQENQGVVKALNTALKLCKGKYVARMDADDICVANRLELQTDYLEKNKNIVLVGGQCYTIDEDGDLIGSINVLTDNYDINLSLLREKLYGDKTHLVHPAVMFRQDVATKISGYDFRYKWAEDRDFFLRMGDFGLLSNLDVFVLYYRHHSESVSVTKNLLQQKSAIAAINAAIERRKLKIEKKSEKNYINKNPIFNHSEFITIYAFNNGYYKAARKHAIRNLMNKPISLRAWKGLALTFFSRSLITEIIRIKNRLYR